MHETATDNLTDNLTDRFVLPAVPALPVEQRAEEMLDDLASLWNELAADDGYQVPPWDYEVPSDLLLSVVIPVYNERRTVLQVIARVASLPIRKEIIVVDDGSTDGTRGWLEIVRGAPGLRIVLKKNNEGKGAALRTGFAAAQGDIVIVQDADLEYDPRDMAAVLRPLIEGRADVVYGSRFLGETQDRSWLHRLLNRLLTEASNCFTGLRLTDMETCYKAFRREAIRSIELKQNRFGFEPEVTAKLARRHYQIVETPIGYQARGYSQGKKIGLRDLANALYCIVRYGLAD